MKRYAAKLLFQYRATVDGNYGQRRTCEERIVLLKANSARRALGLAKRRGRDGQNSWLNSDGNPVDFQFIGVMELLFLEFVSDENEVWYEITERLLPMERAERFIPPEHALNAIRNEPKRESKLACKATTPPRN
jgi:Domain of unknown function (DUF4288)